MFVLIIVETPAAHYEAGEACATRQACAYDIGLGQKEMDNSSHTKMEHKYHEIVSQRNFEDFKRIEFPYVRSGHWGGDKLMFDEIFRGENLNPSLNHAANVRDGSLAVLIGIAARKSIDEGKPIKIADLTDLVPQKNKKV